MNWFEFDVPVHWWLAAMVAILIGIYAWRRRGEKGSK
jgi:cytochrome b561